MHPLTAITAAGASSRMGQPKALLPWGEGTALSTIVQTLKRAGFSAPMVVLGADPRPIEAEAKRVGADTTVNEDWEQGRFTSIRVAAQWARKQSPVASLLLWPVDCPDVSGETLRLLAERAAETELANVVPRFNDRGGHPVLLCPETVGAITRATGDANLRNLLHAAPATRLDIEVGDAAVVANMNCPADYEAAKRDRSQGDEP